jgi:hypothetical protein
MKPPMKVRRDRFLEQYNYVLAEHIDKVKSKYAPRIGLFLIRFSSREHTLDICIADRLLDRSHQFGYVVIQGMLLNGKIELFRKLFQGFVRDVNPKYSARLKLLVTRLHAVGVFRNYIAHANWNTLEHTGYVRTKIDESDGEVIFKKVRITAKVINAWIRRVVKLERRLDDFAESVQHA